MEEHVGAGAESVEFLQIPTPKPQTKLKKAVSDLRGKSTEELLVEIGLNHPVLLVPVTETLIANSRAQRMRKAVYLGIVGVVAIITALSRLPLW